MRPGYHSSHKFEKLIRVDLGSCPISDIKCRYKLLQCILLPDIPYSDASYKMHDTEISHTRRASEKGKRRMKIADLKAFVETKLLSKSEKALEKIGQEEPKALFEQV